MLPLEQLVDQLEQFVKHQSEHLNFEEAEVFPAIEQLAGDADWRELESRLPTPSDPLFGLKQSEEYRDLYKALIEDSASG